MNHIPLCKPLGRRVMYWYTVLLGAGVALLGLTISSGGLWLLGSGSSWYYLTTGAALVFSGLLIAAGRVAGAVLFGFTHLFIFIWTIWDIGHKIWPLAPRVLAPIFLLFLVLLAIPALRQRDQASPGEWQTAAFAMMVLGLTGLGIAILPLVQPPPVGGLSRF